MRVQNVSVEQLQAALALLNKSEFYAGNVEFAGKPGHVGSTKRSAVAFRLAARDCRKRGGRLGFMFKANGKRRRIGGCACWHVHGHFFEALFSIVPGAVIRSTYSSLANPTTSHAWNESTGSITGPSYHAGNWRDHGCGSMMNPCNYSELCDCYEKGWDDRHMFPG